MTCKSTWAESNTGIYREFIGDVSMADILKATIELQEDPRFNSLHYIIDDFTNMISSTFDSKETQAMARVTKVRGNTKESLKIALITRNTPNSIAAATHFSNLIKQSHYQCEVFLSLVDAHDWIATT